MLILETHDFHEKTDMGFFGDLMKGIGNVLGEAALPFDWLKTYNEKGLPLLQIKIRNFLRSASPEQRTQVKNSLRLQRTNPNPQDVQTFNIIYSVYLDELSNYE
jgi:hypothetical protein